MCVTGGVGAERRRPSGKGTPGEERRGARTGREGGGGAEVRAGGGGAGAELREGTGLRRQPHRGDDGRDERRRAVRFETTRLFFPV
jgi:hypothetical protein